MVKGKDVSIYLARIDWIVDLLAAVRVEKKESEVNDHIIRNISNDFGTKTRPPLRNPALSGAEIEDVLRDREFHLKKSKRRINRQALVISSSQGGGARGQRGFRDGGGKREGGGSQDEQSSSGSISSTRRSGRSRRQYCGEKTRRWRSRST